MPLITRASKGSNLTPAEADADLEYLEDLANTKASQTDFDLLETEVGTKADQADLNLKADLISPALVTPALGTPTSGTLTSCIGLPLGTGITGELPVTNLYTTSTLSGTTGLVTITFDKFRRYTATTQTGNITLASTGVIEGSQCIVVVDGDSSHSLTISSNWINLSG